jgi:hypothetical protein
MKLPDGIFAAGEDGCGSLAVVVETGGGRGGDPCYAGGYVTGHIGHTASMLSAAQLRRLAAALTAAADAIDVSGLPSWQQLQGR